MIAKNYKELTVWQLAIEQCAFIYKITEKLPNSERFGLTSQMRRCSVSIPSNIAEGFVRRSDKENLRFISIALGSNAELETQMILCGKLGFLSEDDLKTSFELNEHVGKKLTKYYQTISK